SGDCQVTDLGSLNGTFLNERQLASGEQRRIHQNDRLRLAADVEARVTFES
ncbi:MAG: FHA domain-containing protein, partial [Stackebrandtia sp.]